MRKRNSIVFSLVECEEDYVKQLSALVSVFLRPLRMAASSKTPPISHDDVNSIFLNRFVTTDVRRHQKHVVRLDLFRDYIALNTLLYIYLVRTYCC